VIQEMMCSFVQLTVFLVLLALVSQDVAAIRCYSCEYTINGPGDACVTSPADFVPDPTKDCPTGCQTEAESHDHWASVWHILRGCKMKDESECIDGAAQTCVSVCTENLCNGDPVELSTGPPPTPPTEEPGTRSCWSCTYRYNHPGDDDVCVTDPAGVLTSNYVRCPPSKQCAINRIEFKVYDRVNTFRRGCDPPQSNECVEDTDFITCNSYCNGEFCNNGNGVVHPPAVEEPPPSSGASRRF